MAHQIVVQLISMKKVLLLLLWTVLLSGCSLPFSNRTATPAATSIPSSAAAFNSDQMAQLPPEVAESADVLLLVGNAVIHVPDSNDMLTIQMRDGEGEVLSGSNRVRATLSPPYSLSDRAEDGVIDVALTANFSTEGSTNKQYVALFSNRENNLTHTSNMLIGNGVKITDVKQRAHETNQYSYYLDVNYLDRGPEQPTSVAPTIPKTKTLLIVDHTIQGGDIQK